MARVDSSVNYLNQLRHANIAEPSQCGFFDSLENRKKILVSSSALAALSSLFGYYATHFLTAKPATIIFACKATRIGTVAFGALAIGSYFFAYHCPTSFDRHKTETMKARQKIIDENMGAQQAWDLYEASGYLTKDEINQYVIKDDLVILAYSPFIKKHGPYEFLKEVLSQENLDHLHQKDADELIGAFCDDELTFLEVCDECFSFPQILNSLRDSKEFRLKVMEAFKDMSYSELTTDFCKEAFQVLEESCGETIKQLLQARWSSHDFLSPDFPDREGFYQEIGLHFSPKDWEDKMREEVCSRMTVQEIAKKYPQLFEKQLVTPDLTDINHVSLQDKFEGEIRHFSKIKEVLFSYGKKVSLLFGSKSVTMSQLSRHFVQDHASIFIKGWDHKYMGVVSALLPEDLKELIARYRDGAIRMQTSCSQIVESAEKDLSKRLEEINVLRCQELEKVRDELSLNQLESSLATLQSNRVKAENTLNASSQRQAELKEKKLKLEIEIGLLRKKPHHSKRFLEREIKDLQLHLSGNTEDGLKNRLKELLQEKSQFLQHEEARRNLYGNQKRLQEVKNENEALKSEIGRLTKQTNGDRAVQGLEAAKNALDLNDLIKNKNNELENGEKEACRLSDLIYSAMNERDISFKVRRIESKIVDIRKELNRFQAAQTRIRELESQLDEIKRLEEAELELDRCNTEFLNFQEKTFSASREVDQAQKVEKEAADSLEKALDSFKIKKDKIDAECENQIFQCKFESWKTRQRETNWLDTQMRDLTTKLLVESTSKKGLY